MHYVIGDAHGHYSCLMRLIEKLKLTESDKVILVGDILDRAPSPEEQKKLIDWAMENISPDGQFQMVLGNHEHEHRNRILWAKATAAKINPEKLEETMYDFLLARDGIYGFYYICKTMDIDLDKLVSFINSLPLFKEIEINGIRYIITHSWLLTKGLLGVEDYMSGTINANDFDITESIWDRDESVYTHLDAYGVIHGHTPTVSSAYTLINKTLDAKIIKNGLNINVDCGLFARHSSKKKGNLAAYCIETENEIYLYKK